MIDLKLLRSDPQLFSASMAKRGFDLDIEGLLDLDRRHRAAIAEVEKARAEQNASSKMVAMAKGDDKKGAIEQARDVAQRFAGLEGSLRKLKDEIDALLAPVPNLVHPNSPSDEDLVRKEGEEVPLGFDALRHGELGEAAGGIDTKRAARVSGSRFAFLKGSYAMLEIALIRFALDRVMAHGFVPVIVPVLVHEQAMFGTGFFPTDEAQIYKTADDDLYLVGTSEVSLASMHTGESLSDLPVRYAGFSSCFRREAGTYGKDTHGLIRLHQFEKVEMFSFCAPGESDDEHERILSIQEEIFGALEIPYRVLEIAARELGASAYRKFDLEAWMPAEQRWLEVTSCSNCTDYQARRLGIRTKDTTSSGFVHTLNGTALAVQRTIAALVENHQGPDRSVRIPEALKGYLGSDSL